MVSKIQGVSVEKVSPSVGTSAASSVAVKLPSSSAPRTAMADELMGGGTATVAAVAEVARATGDNPFTALLAATRDVTPGELRLATSDEATSASCEPDLEVLALLSHIERRVTPREVWGPAKVRAGYMQVTYDAQEERVAGSQLERDGSEELARVLVERPIDADAKQIVHGPTWQGAVGGYFKGGDVNAFVQQVLRECYLLGMSDLQLYGDRLKALNELKKKIRDEATRARKYKTEWATAAKGDENWVAPYYYGLMKVDGAQMTLVEAVYTEEDIAALAREKQMHGATIAKEHGAAPVAGTDATDGAQTPNTNDPFWVGSTVGEEDAGFVASLSTVTVDQIRNKKPTFERLKGIVPQMSKSDIENWLIPILENFRHHSHEGGILELLEVMTPEQRLLVAANGFGADSPAFWSRPPGSTHPVDAFSVEERARYNSVMIAAARGIFGSSVAVMADGITTEKAKELWAQYENKQDPAYEAKAPAKSDTPAANPKLSHARLGRPDGMVRQDALGGRNLGVREGALTAPVAETALQPADPNKPAVGQRKTIDTVAGMEDYVKYLEEQMNGVGDDAQLANIDLQNCLQKQQQTLQMMSNISKTLHDVTMAIIRNMNS